MLHLKFSLDGDKKLSRALVGVKTKLKDFTEPLARSSEILLKDIGINFETEGGLVGGWKPLKPSTVKGRLREGYGAGPILQKTRKYKQSFAGKISPKKLIIDAWGIDYHKYHQSVTPRKQGESGDMLPRRKTLFLRKPVREEIQRFFQEYVRFNI